MRRGTTEKKNIELAGIDTHTIQKAVFTIAQGTTRIHKNVTFDSDGNGAVEILPEETLFLHLGEVKEQIKILLTDGTVVATNIISDTVNGDILNEEALE